MERSLRLRCMKNIIYGSRKRKKLQDCTGNITICAGELACWSENGEKLKET